MKKIGKWLKEPRNAMRVHFWMGWFWIALAIVATIFGFIGSTVFISFLSIVALSLAHWAAYQAAESEKEQQEEN